MSGRCLLVVSTLGLHSAEVFALFLRNRAMDRIHLGVVRRSLERQGQDLPPDICQMSNHTHLR